MEFHHTPEDASWLNVAECDLAVFTTQCLDRSLPDLAMLADEAAAWEQQPNRDRPAIRWDFTMVRVRRKLKRLYPHPA